MEEQTVKIPTFAIILPVYNEERNIATCLDSIVNQTMDDWVCYICNDASTDKTLEICKGYAERDSRFIIINSKFNKYTESGKLHAVNKDKAGISNMLNLGISVSNSKYIIRMDGDDEMLPDRLKVTYKWMEEHDDVDVAGFPVVVDCKVYNMCNFMIPDENGRYTVTFESIYDNKKPYHPTVCMRRETVMKKSKFLYQQPYDGSEDTFLWCHLLTWGCKIELADTKPVIIYKGGKNNPLKDDLFVRCRRVYKQMSQKPDYLLHYMGKSKNQVVNDRKLTVVIGFKNENIEVEKTIVSLLLSDDNIDIVLIDDCSDDGYDYKHVAETFGCFYYKSDKPLGCAGARQEGVKHVKTPYFILMDAHMRINVNQKNFSERFVKELDKNPNQIVQCNTVVMKSNADEDSHFRHYTNEDCLTQPEGAACIGAIYNHEHQGRDWAADWCYKYIDEDKTDIRQTANADTIVECVSLMGADYAMSVDWWNKIRGLEGLYVWGHDEPLLSLKTYLLGGRTITYPKYGIGHLYRNSPTYGATGADKAASNLLFIQYLMSHAEEGCEDDRRTKTDDEIFDDYKAQMRALYGDETFNATLKLFNERKEQYDEIKSWLWDNAVRKLSDIRALEARVGSRM